MVKAVHAVHSKTHNVHLDIKPDNILIGDDHLLKLTDFGFVRPAHKKIDKVCGTQGYLAPEQLHLRRDTVVPYDGVKADIFSLGIVLFAIQFGSLPFP